MASIKAQHLLATDNDQSSLDTSLFSFARELEYWSIRLRSWVHIMGRAEGLSFSFILLGADTALQVISEGGKARMQILDACL